MTLLTLQISLASSDDNPPADWAAKCRDWAALVMELGQTIRSISNEMQPSVVDEHGICGALRWFAQKAAGEVNCAIVAETDDISLDPFAANELVAICRELVIEILAPGGVTNIEIEVEQKTGEVRVQVRPAAGSLKGVLTEGALQTLAAHERMLCLKGTAEISETDSGSAVTLTVPVPVTSGSPGPHRRKSQPLPAA